ncbi:MAG: RNA polymerase sigma factor [Acidobacteriota bacterium]
MSSLEDLPDEELVERWRQAEDRDLRAFEILVARHEAQVLANCRYLTGGSEEARDLAQEVFVKAFFGVDGFEGRARFGTWVQRIKINHCLNFLEKNKLRNAVSLEDEVVAVAPQMQVPSRAEQEVVSRRDRRRIAAILRQLPDTLRVPLVLRDADGLSYQQIADTLGVGLSAVKMRIKRGREEFRRRYRREVEG